MSCLAIENEKGRANPTFPQSLGTDASTSVIKGADAG